VLVCTALAGSAAPAAAQTCTVTSVGRLLPTEDGLRVLEAAAPALLADDLLLQLNAKRLRTCADLSATLQLADRDRLVPVLALRRGGTLHTVALVLVPTPVIQVVELRPTPALETTPTPMQIAAGAVGPLQQMVATLRRFDEETALPLVGPQPFARRLDALRAAYAGLLSGAPAVSAVEPVLGYYDAVKQILVYREDAATRRADRQDSAKSDLARARPEPGAAYEYNTGGPVSEWLERYPFLQPAVVREPQRWMGQVEEAGRWQPDEAIRLLMAKARADTDAVAGRLSGDGR
jgi:hypothetical protein